MLPIPTLYDFPTVAQQAGTAHVEPIGTGRIRSPNKYMISDILRRRHLH